MNLSQNKGVIEKHHTSDTYSSSDKQHEETETKTFTASGIK